MSADKLPISEPRRSILEEAAKAICNLVEDEAWEHMSEEDEEKAIRILDELVATGDVLN
jgi:hypothetical protein